MLDIDDDLSDQVVWQDLIQDGKLIDEMVRQFMNEFTMQMIKLLVKGHSYTSAYDQVIGENNFCKYKDKIIWFKGEQEAHS